MTSTCQSRRHRVPRELGTAPPLDPARRCGPPVRRRALLVNPFYAKDPHASFGKHVLTPSLALTSIAGATPLGWTVTYHDENVDVSRGDRSFARRAAAFCADMLVDRDGDRVHPAPPCEPFPEVVGITVHLTFAQRAFELAKWYRDRGAIVILGGLHVISCPEECRPHADALAIGEGVQVWPEFLADVDAGTVRPVYRGDYARPYRDDPPPRRDILPRRSFLTTTSLIATRGCHNRCGFCYLATDGLSMPYRMRDPDQIVAEFLSDGRPYAVFIDNNLGSRPEYLRRLCRALAPIERIWSAAVTLDVTDDPSLVRDMALGGCTGVFIGLETLSDLNLAEARKKTPKTEDYERRVRILHDHGIQVNGSFVLGFDHDGPDVFERTVAWIERMRLECATFHILTPYPGTPLFRQMNAEGRILHRDWNLYDTAHVVFRPKLMNEDQLAAGYDWCYRTLFTMGSIWRRRPEDASAVLPYLAMSMLYKRSNRLWHRLIRHDLTADVWSPIVEFTRRRHLGFRRRLAQRTCDAGWSGVLGRPVAGV